MKGLSTSLLAIAMAACASTPPGPSDAEVRAQVDQALEQAVQAVRTGDTDSFLTYFAPQGTMKLRGIVGPDGAAINVDLVGPDQIRPFLIQVGPPPEFVMQVSGFSREGPQATQTGTWTIGGDQAGPFSLTWSRTEQGEWRIVAWRFDAG